MGAILGFIFGFFLARHGSTTALILVSGIGALPVCGLALAMGMAPLAILAMIAAFNLGLIAAFVPTPRFRLVAGR